MDKQWLEDLMEEIEGGSKRTVTELEVGSLRIRTEYPTITVRTTTHEFIIGQSRLEKSE